MRPPPPNYPRRLIGNGYGGDTTAVICPSFHGSRREGSATLGDTGDTQDCPPPMANRKGDIPMSDNIQFDTTHQRELIAALLAEAIQYITNSSRFDDSAAWRVADAGLLLRELMEEDNNNLPGLDKPTGRGALLPTTTQGVQP